MTKPTVEELGIDVGAQTWHRSGGRDGAIEVAFVGMVPGEPAGGAPVNPAAPGEWVLMRVAGDPAGRVLVYDRFEWECFLDGVKHGEFDDATELPGIPAQWPANRAKVTIPNGERIPT